MAPPRKRTTQTSTKRKTKGKKASTSADSVENIPTDTKGEKEVLRTEETEESERQKRQKHQTFIMDFKTQFNNRVEHLERQAEILKGKLQSIHKSELLKMTSQVRNKKWVDFIASPEENPPTEETFAVPLPPPTIRKPKRKPSKQNVGVAAQTPMIPSTGAGRKKNLPLITPKCDPRDKFTPMRGPRGQEITWSAKGSPVMAGGSAAMMASNTNTATLTVGVGGKVLEVTTGSNEDPLPQLAAEEEQQLMQLKRKLSIMLRK